MGGHFINCLQMIIELVLVRLSDLLTCFFFNEHRINWSSGSQSIIIWGLREHLVIFGDIFDGTALAAEKHYSIGI